jgi:sugar phosphate isomerase/epimerase
MRRPLAKKILEAQGLMALEVALSTMWAIGQFPSLTGFFEAGRELGFSRFELNHAVDSSMLEGLSLDGEITSIHEPCPADISMKVLKCRNWLISASDEEDRRQGVLVTRRSIDLAHRLGAQAVVVHPGKVDVDPSLESALVDLYITGQFDQPVYAMAKERLEAARAAQAEHNMRSVRQSLIELADYAERRRIRLGLENRLHYLEIPLPHELEDLLALDLGETVGYWHDIGHAQVLEHLGFNPHEAWLRQFAERMIGVHLHDVVGVTDHLAPGLGQVDWTMVATYLPASALRTCEFKSPNTPHQVSAGLRLLADCRILRQHK